MCNHTSPRRRLPPSVFSLSVTSAASATERLFSISEGLVSWLGAYRGKFVTPGATNLQCAEVSINMNCQYFWVFIYENHIFNVTLYHNNLKPRHQVGEDRGRNESLHELLFERIGGNCHYNNFPEQLNLP